MQYEAQPTKRNPSVLSLRRAARCIFLFSVVHTSILPALTLTTAPRSQSSDEVRKPAATTAAAVTFRDVTLEAGLSDTGFAFGNPIWGDFDNDGSLDLFVDNHYNRASYLYQNLGNG